MIEGQIKELQGVVPNIPRAKNDQKSPGRIGLKVNLCQIQSWSAEGLENQIH